MIALLFIVVLVGVIQGYSALWARQTKNKLRLSIQAKEAVLTDGQQVELWLVLENASWMPIPWLEVSQRLPEELQVLADGEWRQDLHYNTYLLPRQRVQRRFFIRVVRGLHRFESAEVRFGDGIGLQDHMEDLASDAALLVRPQLLEHERLPFLLTELIGERTVQRWYQEDMSRLQGIRTYQPGDPFKHIHWAATARVGDLMVKQFETTSETDFYLLLNHQFFEAYWMGTNRAIVNETCRLAASLLYQAAEQGFAYGLYTNGAWAGRGGLTVPLAQGAQQFQQVLDGLGGILYRASGPFEELLQKFRGQVLGRATVAIITAVWNERIAAHVEHMRAAGQHVLLLVDERLTGELAGLSGAVQVVPIELAVGEAELLADTAVARVETEVRA